MKKAAKGSLDLEEIELLRDACTGSRERAMLELFFANRACGLDELSQIDVPDLNWVTGPIRVIGKGNKERVVYFSPKALGVYIKNICSSARNVKRKRSLLPAKSRITAWGTDRSRGRSGRSQTERD